jgi:hypothetical protein
VSAFERVPGNAICTPAEQAERGYVSLSGGVGEACEGLIASPGVPLTAGVSIVRKRAGAPQQAMQYTGTNLAEVMGWITETGETPFLSVDDRYLLIGTPSDYTGAAPGDWVIRSPGNCFGFGHDLADADEFAALYEPAGASAAHGDRDEEIARLRGSLDAAEAKLASYDSAISWATSCTACAKTLDGSIADHDRAVVAEAKLAAIGAHIEAKAAEASAALPMYVHPKSVRINGGDVLAIISGEEAGDGR